MGAHIGRPSRVRGRYPQPMHVIDIALLGLLAFMGVMGMLQGFIVAALSIVGLALGAVLGTRIAPLVLEGSSSSAYTPLVGLVLGLVLATMLTASLQDLGLWLRGRMYGEQSLALDRLLGGVLAALIGCMLVWICAAVVMTVPQLRNARTYVVQSRVVAQLNGVMPPSGPLLNSIVRYDPFPAFRGPTILINEPSGDTPRDPQVRAAARSVVRVVGEACGLTVTGSGWAVAPGRVVTNAHVVAGEHATAVQVGGRGREIPARVVAFDSNNDVAVLDVPGLDLRPLQIATAVSAGTSAAVLGYPENGAFDVEPARLGEQQSVRSQDIYGRGPIERPVSSFRGLVRHGNSGGPIVDGDGRVLTTVFAAALGSSVRGGYGVPNDVVVAAVRGASERPLDTGACVT